MTTSLHYTAQRMQDTLIGWQASLINIVKKPIQKVLHNKANGHNWLWIVPVNCVLCLTSVTTAPLWVTTHLVASAALYALGPCVSSREDGKKAAGIALDSALLSCGATALAIEQLFHPPTICKTFMSE